MILSFYSLLWLSVAFLMGPSAAHQADGEQIRVLEKRLEEGILRKDMPALEQLMSPDYVLVGMGATGMQEVPRDAWLKTLAAMQIEAYQAEIKRVRIYGDSAVVNIEGSWKVTLGANKIDDAFFLTDVWIKRVDRWQVVLRHSTRGSRP